MTTTRPSAAPHRLRRLQNTLYFERKFREVTLLTTDDHFHPRPDRPQERLINLYIPVHVAIHRKDYITLPETSFFGRRVLHHIRHHDLAIDKGERHAAVTVIEWLPVRPVPHQVNFRMRIIHDEIESPEQIVPDQSAQLRIAGHVVGVVKNIGGNLVELEGADREILQRRQLHLLFPAEASTFRAHRAFSFRPEYRAVCGEIPGEEEAKPGSGIEIEPRVDIPPVAQPPFGHRQAD